MFGIDSSEFLLIAVVALIVIGPKDLPRVMRLVGGWVGKGRAMTRHLRSGFDTMMREAELEEMQKQWAKQNAEIMAATTPAAVAPHAYDPAGRAAAYDPVDPHAWAAPAHDTLAAPHDDAVVGEQVFDHPGALPVAEHAALDHSHADGDVGSHGGRDATMQGPQPSVHALAAAEPALPLDMPTAQP